MITFRNFADTDGDGVRDRLGDAVSEFGNAASTFINAKAGTIQVTGQNTVLTGLATFENAGIVDLRTGAPGNVMTITNGGVGTFVSNGGSLLINTRLGSDNSPTDKLVVDGTAVGPGGANRVFVTNVGGLGAFTTGDGIQIIEVKDSARSAAGAFTLGQRVAAGTYEYHLEHGSAVGAMSR